MVERYITPMGERMIQQRGANGLISMVVEITDQENSRIESDALQIREVFLKNNPTIRCMSKDEIYYFLLGVYCREMSQGEYKKVANDRITYSQRTHGQTPYRNYM